MIKKLLAKTKNNKILIAIFLLAFLVRVIGVFPGHPSNHPDEPMSFGSAIEMLVHKDLNPRRFDYPAGVPLVHYVFFQIFIMPFLYLKTLFTNPGLVISSFVSGTNILVLNPNVVIGVNGILLLYSSRFLTALLGALSVLLVYKIAQKLFNKNVGLFSAFFLAFNYRHGLSSHLALSDIPNSFFMLLAFYSCVLLFEKNTAKRYFIAALCVGLSFSMKYQIFVLIPFLFVHLLWFLKKKRIKYLFNKNFIIGLFIVPLVFCLLNPYLFFNLKTAIPMIQYVSLRYGMGAQKFNDYAFFYLMIWGIGILPFFMILLGGIVMLFRNFVKFLILFSYVGVFLYMFLYYSTGGEYVRNFTTVIPLLMIFAGYAFYQLCAFASLAYKKIPFFILFIILILINLDPIKSSITLASDYSKPWSRDTLNLWVEKHIPENSTIRNDNIAVSESSKKLNLINWNHIQDNSIEDLIDAKDDFAVLNASWQQINLFWSDMKLKELLSYMDIPYRRLRDSYFGLASSEFRNYTVWESYKSWEAPEDSYMVLKIPKFPDKLGRKIREFHFEADTQDWKFYDFSGFNRIEKISWNAEGQSEEPGSLEMTGSVANSEFSRLISPFIKIIPGKSYFIEAYVKNGAEIKETQWDGYFRIDIYNDARNSLLSQDPLQTAVSGRIHGVSKWWKKRMMIKVPIDGNYLTISFQRSSLGSQTPYFIDNITIYQIDDFPEDPFPNTPYIKATLPDDLLFPIGVY